MTEDQILVHTMTFKPKENRKLQIKWMDKQGYCALIFKRMLDEGESPKEPTCSVKHRLGVKTTSIGLSDEMIPYVISGLIQYLEEKNHDRRRI